MSNEEYIASGVLELYAAGGLTQEEREEVELRAANSPEINAALEETCAAMETYARMHAVSPRSELKNKILGSIPDKANKADVAEIEQNSKVIPIYTRDKEEASPYKWMFAASIILFIISGMLSYHFYNKWQQTEEHLAIASASERTMAQNMETVSLKVNQLEQNLSVLRDPSYRLVRLQGVEAYPEANILVYWSPEKEQVFIGAIKLPQPPTGKQYQLWALYNGKPVDAGMIALSDNEAVNLQKMKTIPSAQAFAVTLEPVGGSLNPTLEQLIVIGEVNV